MSDFFYWKSVCLDFWFLNFDSANFDSKKYAQPKKKIISMHEEKH